MYVLRNWPFRRGGRMLAARRGSHVDFDSSELPAPGQAAPARSTRWGAVARASMPLTLHGPPDDWPRSAGTNIRAWPIILSHHLQRTHQRIVENPARDDAATLRADLHVSAQGCALLDRLLSTTVTKSRYETRYVGIDIRRRGAVVQSRRRCFAVAHANAGARHG